MFHYICKGAALLGFSHLCEKDGKDIQGLKYKFHEYMVEEGLSFATREEYEFRFDIFMKNEKEIQEMNAWQKSFELGHNFFSTMTEEEIEKYMGFKLDESDKEELHYSEFADFGQVEIPSSVDWRTKGAVNKIKNQGQCGSCWAFGSTAAVEAHHFIKTGKLLSLSEQQLVSCANSQHYGCNGGSANRAYGYLKKKAQATERDYPYGDLHGAKLKCDSAREAKGVVKVPSYSRVKPNSVPSLKEAISKGVVAVAVDASGTFRKYRSGIMDSTKCGTKINHMVAAVGYGTDAKTGKEYYIVRNSWTTRWGDKGYIKIAAVAGKGICGVQQYGYLPNTD